MSDLLERLTLLESGARWQDTDAADTIAEARDEITRLRTVTPAMVAAACDVEPINFRDMTDEMRGDGLNLTAKLRAENMRRRLQAALEARE